MEEQKQISLKIIIFVVALIIGLGAGYYYGNSRGLQKGKEAAKLETEAAQKKLAEEAVKAANPFETVKTNPLETANPYKDVKINPFR